MDREEQHLVAEAEVLAALRAALDEPEVHRAALVHSETQFAEIFDSMFAERLTVPAPKTQVGEQTISFFHLTFFEHVVQRARAMLSPDDTSPLAALLSQALGEVPSEETVRELRHRYDRPERTDVIEAPETLGTYVLSAGTQPPVDHSFARLCLLLGAKKVEPGSFIDQLAALVDLLSVLQTKLLLTIQRRLTPTAYAYEDHVPPVACSPCGVIRMASPLVPRGPELAVYLGTPSPSWALAA
ncbi:hypothetical protein [Streptomyces collinus]|uniref:hypothetical protein n=1 Tax=Streptomyces collinus TaxID=42684 RepID=UPI0037CD2E63